ncbi:MAG: LysE family translocator [Pseudomonadota bacterium]
MDLSTYLAFVAACIAIVVVPGPTVTVIIANALRHGWKAGALNVLGTQAGLCIMIAIVTFGLAAVVSIMGEVFDIVRLLGAAYLIWLGIRMWRSKGDLGAAKPLPRFGFFTQGFVVIWSNPKALLFFGAFIPQFVDPAAGDAALQTALLGGTFMVVATVFDMAYAVLAGRAGQALTRSRVRIVERVSGTLLIGGGGWLALRSS